MCMRCGCGRESKTPKPAKNSKYQMGDDPLKRNTTWGRNPNNRKSSVKYPKGRRFG